MTLSHHDRQQSPTASVIGAMKQQVQRDQGRSAPDKVGMDQGMRALSYLISGVLLYGALGWVVDHFLHTRFLLPIGIVLGAGLGIYLTIKRFQATELESPDTKTTEGER